MNETKVKGSSRLQMKGLHRIEKRVRRIIEPIGCYMASGIIKDIVIVASMLVATTFCVILFFCWILPACMRTHGSYVALFSMIERLSNGVSNWGEHAISFVTFANSVVSAAFTAYIKASTTSTHGLQHVEILGFKEKRVYSHVLVYLMACLTLIFDVLSQPLLLFFCAMLSMLLTGRMLLRANRVSSLTDGDLLRLLRGQLYADPQHWRKLIQTAFDCVAEQEDFSSEISFFHRCFLDSWQTLCKRMTSEQVRSDGLFKDDFNTKTILFNNICYLQQLILHKLKSRKKALFRYVTQTIAELETVRCESFSSSKRIGRVNMACFDLYSYITCLNLIFFLKDITPHWRAISLLKIVAKQMPVPQQQDIPELRALFKRTRALAVWYCLEHHLAVTPQLLQNLGVEGNFLFQLLLINPLPQSAAIHEDLMRFSHGSNIVLKDNSVLAWYRQCRIVFEGISSLFE